LDTDLIKYAAFSKELEKLAFRKYLAKLVTKFPELVRFGKKFKSFANTAAKSEHAFASKVFKEGKIFDEGLNAMKTETGKITHKPMLGVKSKEAIGFREFTPNSNYGKKLYEKNPLVWGKSILERQADTFNYARKHGILKTIGKHISESGKYYTKEFKGANGKYYQGKFKRSLAGKVLGFGLGSGAAFGGLEYMNKTDDKGNQLSQGQRIAKGLGETFKWTVAEPIMVAKMGLYDLPKLGIDMIKPKKKEYNNGF